MGKVSKKIFQFNQWIFRSNSSKDPIDCPEQYTVKSDSQLARQGFFHGTVLRGPWHLLCVESLQAVDLQSLIGHGMNEGGRRVLLVLSAAQYQGEESNSAWLDAHSVITDSICVLHSPPLANTLNIFHWKKQKGLLSDERVWKPC